MRPRVGLFVACALLLPLVVSASASAQGSVLQASDQVVTPGQVITVTGNSFTSAPGYSPPRIRLNSRNGRVLKTANPPDSLGVITEEFPIPLDLRPGWYLLVATQTVDANGRHKSFSPGRTRIRVQAAAAGAAAGGPGGGGGWPGSPLAIVALLTVAAVTTLFVRRLRTANRPQLGS